MNGLLFVVVQRALLCGSELAAIGKEGFIAPETGAN